MKKSKRIFMLTVLGLALASFICITSCRKQEVTTDDENNSSYQTESEKVSNDIDNIADAAANNNLSEFRVESIVENSNILTTCATITRDSIAPTSFKYTIDFGTVGCAGKDGKTRKGKIIVTCAGRYFDDGAVRTITFESFSVNGNKIEGTRTVTNKGKNATGNYYWEIVANGMKITRANGNVISWESTRQREMIAGYGTPTCLDDVYLISGSFTGTRPNGDTYTATITTNLRREVVCKEFVSGIIEVINTSTASKSKIAKMTIDYGTGDCDNNVTVTVTYKNGKTKTKIIST